VVTTRTIGIALSVTDLYVGDRRIPLQGEPDAHGQWPDLSRALRDALPSGIRQLAVALLPPLVEVRNIALPPMDATAAIQVLSRNAPRYFVGARGPQVVGVRSRSDSDSGVTVLAAAAPLRLISALEHAAADAGATISSIMPAESAWTAAALATWPTLARRRSHLIVVQHDRTTLIAITDRAAVSVRHFRPAADDADRINADLMREAGAPGAVAILGASPLHPLAQATASRGIGLLGSADTNLRTMPVEAVAATFAAVAAGPRLRSDAARAAQHRRIGRAVAAIFAAAALLLVFGAASMLWGVRRELRRVAEERAALRPQLNATLVGRSSLEDAYRRLAAIASAQRHAPHWASVLGQLSAALPDDAYFTAFRTRGDTVTVDGLAVHAAEAFEALNASPWLMNVRAPGPVRRQAPDGGDPLERFTLAAQLRRAGADNPGPPVASTPRTAP
jgi:hypothetical protein